MEFIKVSLKSVSGLKYTVIAPSNANWERVMSLLSDQTNIPVTLLELYYRDQFLDSKQPISDLKLNENDFILFCVKIKYSNTGKQVMSTDDMINFIEALRFSKEHATAALDYFHGDLSKALVMLIRGELTN